MGEHFDVVVIGGGGAGLMCAFTAGQRGKRVLVLEHNERVGKKIEISGGGRCNFTNLAASAANYLSERPDFCKSALARYTPWDFVSLVEKHGIPYHEKKLGQQFCDGSSRAIIQMLLKECADAGVDVRCGARVLEVRKEERFRIGLGVEEVTAESLVLATGGLSFPKLGATDFGLRIARQFGLRITPLRPALVPLTFPPELQDLGKLSGVALGTVARCGQGSFEEAMLFTHRGLSGPAVLQVSSFWREEQTITFDLLPAAEMGDAVLAARASGKTLDQVLDSFWPKRLVETWCERFALPKPLVHYKQAEFDTVIGRLRAWKFTPGGTEGYAKAEVMLGGVDTGELSSKTMEARNVPGLYFIGEVVDMTGWLGGYNFQWAWSSGFAAGTAM